jgi:hypothetical protein
MARLAVKKYFEDREKKISKTIKLQPIKYQKINKQWQNISL